MNVRKYCELMYVDVACALSVWIVRNWQAGAPDGPGRLFAPRSCPRLGGLRQAEKKKNRRKRKKKAVTVCVWNISACACRCGASGESLPGVVG